MSGMGEPPPGCDCTSLCSMGPTCPGGILAGLPGAGCWRETDPGVVAELIEFAEGEGWLE